MMGLAMSYTPKSNDTIKKCPLFEKERVEFYENRTSTNRRDRSDSGSSDIKVLDINAFCEDKPTTLKEKSTVLCYTTPSFRAWAKVRVPPLVEGQTWQIGWIQACSAMRFINTYGDKGCSSWEFQELDTGLYPMISDSDGRAPPWYGTAKQNVRTIVGPTTEAVDLMLMMHDNFYPSVTWHIPYPQRLAFLYPGRYTDLKPRLTHIIRDQSFFTWLVARDMTNQVWYVLKTCNWRACIEISSDPQETLGNRSKLVAQKMTSGSCVLDDNVMMPKCVLFPPNANSAQILVWRSAGKIDRSSFLVVPPHSTAVQYKIQRKLGVPAAITPQISQCTHGKVTLVGRDQDERNQEHASDYIGEIEAYLSLQHKARKDQNKMEKISFLL